MIKRTNYTLDFSEVTLKDLPKVGCKNASLGELYDSLKLQNVNVPDGFATTADAFWRFLKENHLGETLRKIMSDFDVNDTKELQDVW